MWTGKHVLGLSLSATGIIGFVASGAEWISTHVTATGTQICASGLPTGPVQVISGLLTAAGTVVLLLAASINHQTNKDAVRAVEPAALKDK